MKVYSRRYLGRSIIGAAMLALAIPAQAEEIPSEITTNIAAAPEGGRASGKAEKLICKRFPDTTSRMKSVRACHTKADWRKLEDGQF